MSKEIVASFPGYSPGRNEWRRQIHAAVALEMTRTGMTFQESDRLEVEVRLVMTTSQFNFHDVDNRLKDVLDALQARVGGPKSVRLLAPLIPNDKQVTRALIEKVEGAEPNGVLTIRVVR